MRQGLYYHLLFIFLSFFIFFNSTSAEEGMWTFDSLPVDSLQVKYQFTPSQEWIDHIRLSTVRFNTGGTGAFISLDGLVLTNHHVALGILQKISNLDCNYVSCGFYAKTYQEEIQCPDLELSVLMNMKDVTSEILEAVKDSMNDFQALNARQAVIANLEKDAKDKTGLRSEIISMFHGGEYWLFQYKIYTDIRLVMAPERQIAYFGGDDDNFTYPRYDLDIAFFRVYENNNPLKSEHSLKLNRQELQEDELVMISGHPGRTSRLYTVDQLKYTRDIHMPLILDYIIRRIEIAQSYARLGPEQQRRALNLIFNLQNSLKSFQGMMAGLEIPGVMEKKTINEQEFKEKILADSVLTSLYGDVWDTLSAVSKIQSQNANTLFYHKIIGSKLADWAIQTIFYHEEILKPDEERLDGFNESELDEFRFGYLSRSPVFKDFEIHNFTGCLELCLEKLGYQDPFIQEALYDQLPASVVKNIIENTSMDQIDFRKKLLEGNMAMIDTCNDPLILWAKRVAPIIRADIELNRKTIQGKTKRFSERLARARFAVYGKKMYPDANFTLRLTYGSVKGYAMNGTKAPFKTTLYGLYDRSLSFNREGDYDLPERFWSRKKKLNLSTPANFVCTCDIIGGNSGSPVINRKGECVGLAFDGNIESLPGRYYFDISVNRTVSVSSAFIIEALRKLYDAKSLANEIEGK